MVEQVSSLKTGVKYKETPIGKIPVDWEVAKLSELAIIKKNAIVDGDWIEIKDQSSSGYRLLQVGNIGVGQLNLGGNFRYVSEETIKRLNCTILQKGYVLISRMPDPIGRACLMAELDYKCITVVDCTIVKLDPQKVDSSFVVFFLNSQPALNRAKVLATGTTRQRISRKELEGVPLIAPSLPEQKMIAEILTTVDDATEKATQIIDKTKELKKGLMQRLLTRGIGHTRFKKTEIGEIPVAWSLKSIEEVCEILDKQRVPLNKEQREMMKGDIPYYGANGIVDYINDYIFEDDLILMAEDGGYFDEYIHRPIAYLIHGKSWVNNHAHVLKVMKPNDTLWVYYSIVHKNIIPFIKGGTRSKLNQKDLRKIPIPVPPLREQKRIADILSSTDDEIQKESNHRDRLNSLKKGLMQVLLTGKLRVIV